MFFWKVLAVFHQYKQCCVHPYWRLCTEAGYNTEMDFRPFEKHAIFPLDFHYFVHSLRCWHLDEGLRIKQRIDAALYVLVLLFHIFQCG